MIEVNNPSKHTYTSIWMHCVLMNGRDADEKATQNSSRFRIFRFDSFATVNRVSFTACILIFEGQGTSTSVILVSF